MTLIYLGFDTFIDICNGRQEVFPSGEPSIDSIGTEDTKDNLK